MDYLSLPLEVRRDGSLATTTLEDSIVSLIEAAARTPPSDICDWCPSFGILDLLEKQTQTGTGLSKPHLMREATIRLNQSIEILSGRNCKVVSILPKSDEQTGSCTFEVSVVWNDG